MKYTFIISLIAFPFEETKKNLKKNFFTLSLGITLCSLPFILYHFDLTFMFKNIAFFAIEWEMNSGAFRLFRWVGEFKYSEQTQIVEFASFISAILLIVLIGLLFFSRKVITTPKKLFLILTGLILLSPVCNPWYFLWVLPPAIIIEGKSGFWARYFFLGTPLYYLNFLPGNMHEEIFISSLNIQHLWYWICFLMILKSKETIETSS
jgi:hypothetical protein